MGTNREKYIIIFALESAQDGLFLARIFGESLTRKYGGCTITNANGYWAKDGEQDKENYGELMIETAYKIEVVTMTDKEHEIKKLFKDASIEALKRFNVITENQWIHFEHTKVYCEHFQI